MAPRTFTRPDADVMADFDQPIVEWLDELAGMALWDDVTVKLKDGSKRGFLALGPSAQGRVIEKALKARYKNPRFVLKLKGNPAAMEAKLKRFEQALVREMSVLIREASGIARLAIKSRARFQKIEGGHAAIAQGVQVMPVRLEGGRLTGGMGSVRALNAATKIGQPEDMAPGSGYEEADGKQAARFRAFGKVWSKVPEDGRKYKHKYDYAFGWWFNQEFGKRSEVTGGAAVQENPSPRKPNPFAGLTPGILRSTQEGVVAKGKRAGVGIVPGRFMRHGIQTGNKYFRAHLAEAVARAKKGAGFR